MRNAAWAQLLWAMLEDLPVPNFFAETLMVFLPKGKADDRVVEGLHDQLKLSPSWQLERLLRLVSAENISVQPLAAEPDDGDSWVLELLLQWRAADPESTAPHHRGVRVAVRVIDIGGLQS